MTDYYDEGAYDVDLIADKICTALIRHVVPGGKISLAIFAEVWASLTAKQRKNFDCALECVGEEYDCAVRDGSATMLRTAIDRLSEAEREKLWEAWKDAAIRYSDVQRPIAVDGKTHDLH